MLPDPKFGFYERVKVRTADPTKCHLNGEIGTILGRTETEEHPVPFYYAVSIDSLRRTWCLFENELESTGEWARREDHETGQWVRVRVDERGRGTIVPRGEEGIER